jgi:outer membrane lipoprotein SlyB
MSSHRAKRWIPAALLCIAAGLAPMGALWAEDEHHEDEDRQACGNCGVVTAVKAVEQGSSGLVGAATGALAGGLLGHQAGKTEAAASTVGGTAATLVGAAAGALGGHYAEKSLTGSKEWQVTVKMSSGDSRTIAMKTEPKVQAGDHVRVEGDKVVPDKKAAKSDKEHEED